MLETSVQPFASGRQHLLSEFRRLDLLLEREVLRLRGMRQFLDDPFRGLHIAEAQIDAILSPAKPDEAALAELNRQIDELARHIAARTTVALPLRRLQTCFNLSDFERDVLLLAAA